MPDAQGKLTPAEKQTVQSRLIALGWTGRAGCPVCGDNQWTIADHFVQPITRGAANSLNLGGPGYPQVMLISNKCGYTMYFNAVVIGLFRDEPSEKQDG
jgi:hypothetical protein